MDRVVKSEILLYFDPNKNLLYQTMNTYFSVSGACQIKFYFINSKVYVNRRN